MNRLHTLCCFSSLLFSTAVIAQPVTTKPDASQSAVQAKGPVRLKVRLRKGKIDVGPSKGNRVEAHLRRGKPGTLTLHLDGDIARVLWNGKETIDKGDLELRIPPKSSVWAAAIAADVTIEGLGGDVAIEAVSGDVETDRARNIDIEAVSGDITATRFSGDVSVETVSGDVKLENTAAAKVDVETVSGDIAYTGVCAATCRMDLESLSGDVDLLLDAKKSAFELEFESFSGKLTDALGLTENSRTGKALRGNRYTGRYGKTSAFGELECETHSGDVRLKKK